MRTAEIKQAINKLDIIDRINLIEELWDSIAVSNNNIPIYEWQKKELDRRYQKYKNGDYKLHDWMTVHENLRKNS